jgi:hypothetical protein
MGTGEESVLEKLLGVDISGHSGTARGEKIEAGRIGAPRDASKFSWSLKNSQKS